MSEPATIEQMETFEKQTFRNRALIRDAKGELVRLTIPVKKIFRSATRLAGNTNTGSPS